MKKNSRKTAKKSSRTVYRIPKGNGRQSGRITSEANYFANYATRSEKRNKRRRELREEKRAKFSGIGAESRPNWSLSWEELKPRKKYMFYMRYELSGPSWAMTDELRRLIGSDPELGEEFFNVETQVYGGVMTAVQLSDKAAAMEEKTTKLMQSKAPEAGVKFLGFFAREMPKGRGGK